MRRALVLLALPLVLSACGGSSSSLRDTARFAPRNASVFVAVQTHDDHWRSFAQQLLGDLPSVPRDAKEVAFAVVDGQTRVVTQALAHSLADTKGYRDALADIPKSATAIAYARGEEAQRRLLSFPGQVVVTSQRLPYRTIRRPRDESNRIAQLVYRWGVAWQGAASAGARAKSGGLPVVPSLYARGVQQLAKPYTPTLVDEIPDDALVVFDFPLAQGSIENLPAVPKLVTTIFHGTRFAIPLDLDLLLQGETAIYARPGGEVTIVSSPPDTGAALRALDELLHSRNPPFDRLRLHHAVLGGQIVISTTAQGIERFRGGGAKLASKLDLPDQLTAFEYVAPGGENALQMFGLRNLRPQTSWLLPDGADPTLTVRFAGGSG
jgi:hypothetical protein